MNSWQTLAARESFDVRRFDRKAIESRVNAYVNGWRALLTKRVEDGRQLLREVLAGPLRFTPTKRSYQFEGKRRSAGLRRGSWGYQLFLASPTGTANSWNMPFVGRAA